MSTITINPGKCFVVGLDLGQAQDFTALVVMEKPATEDDVKPVLQIRYIERFILGTPYPTIAKKVKFFMTRPELKENSRLIVDATGVGKAVVDLLRVEGLSGLIPVTITGGEVVTKDDSGYKVPKRELVGILQVLLQTDRLFIDANLRLSQELLNELLNFKVKIDPKTAHDSYGAWREGTHDDLVLATALAAWYAEDHCHPLTVHTSGRREFHSILDQYTGGPDWTGFL